ncbi:hypothetical protein ACFY4C_34475 [Actinomadura viridis]|uniref:hypothetical protein n=1 Tax=Actinomadura viridis TaxID=58110 RepID=UPI00369372DE
MTSTRRAGRGAVRRTGHESGRGTGRRTGRGAASGAGRRSPVLVRIAGYGGALALVAAAIVVLLMPLLGKDRKAGGEQPAAGSGPAATGPSRPAPGGAGALAPVPQQTRDGAGPREGQGEGRPAQGQGGGPPMPGQGGGTLTWCPPGTAVYAVTGTTLKVTVHVSTSGLVRAEASLRGRPAVSEQDTARAGRPYTFTFAGITAAMLERVKVTTVSVGVAMQTCYARAAN